LISVIDEASEPSEARQDHLGVTKPPQLIGVVASSQFANGLRVRATALRSQLGQFFEVVLHGPLKDGFHFNQSITGLICCAITATRLCNGAR
jgi:hypothetical protein